LAGQLKRNKRVNNFAKVCEWADNEAGRENAELLTERHKERIGVEPSDVEGRLRVGNKSFPDVFARFLIFIGDPI